MPNWPLMAGICGTLAGLLVGHATAWGAPIFGERRSYPVGTSPLALVTGEFNQQPGLDLATANEDNTITILRNVGGGVFETDRSSRVGIDERFAPTGMVSGSFNDDAVTDFALSADDSESFPDFDGALVIYQSNDRILFRYGRTARSVGLFPICVTAGDLTGDGLTDLATCGSDREGSGLISVLRRASRTAFAAFAEDISLGSVIPSRLVVADVDADGRQDLLVLDASLNTVYAMYGRTTGALFDPPVVVATVQSPAAAAVGEFVEGSLPGVVIASRGEGALVAVRQTSRRTFSTPDRYPTGVLPVDVAVADFTGDGMLDVVVVNFGSNDVTLLHGQGDGTFEYGETVAVGQGAVAIVTGDFNDDGKPDFATADQDDETFGRGVQSVSVVLNGVSPPTPVGPGDTNCDGLIDERDVGTIVRRIFDGVSGCVSGPAHAADITATILRVLSAPLSQ